MKALKYTAKIGLTFGGLTLKQLHNLEAYLREGISGRDGFKDMSVKIVAEDHHDRDVEDNK